MVRSSTPYYFDVDGLGSATLVNNASGTVQDNYVLDAWGNSKAQTVNVANPFTYTARESADAGLMYYRARYYNPSIGRFVSEDPVPTDPNKYAYVVNHPTDYVDPLGLHEKCTHAYAAQWDMGPIAGVEHRIDDLRGLPLNPSHFNLIMFLGSCETGKPAYTRLIVPPKYAGVQISVQFTFDAGPTATVWGVSVGSTWTLLHRKSGFFDLASKLVLCYDCDCDKP
jgi:RHS repeat-associated protein